MKAWSQAAATDCFVILVAVPVTIFATFAGTAVLMCLPLARYHAVSDLYIYIYI